MNKTILQELKEKKEILSLNKAFIYSTKMRSKELRESADSKGYNKFGLYVYEIIKTNTEMINKRIKENQQLEKEILTIEEKINNMLKYFKADRPLMQLGKMLKLLSKKYANPFENSGLSRYNVELWVLINYAIENNIRFYLQYKTLVKECLKVYDNDLKRWV